MEPAGMEAAHQIILLGGVLGVVSILAGAFASRFKAPLLLVFLGLGMLAGDDGPGQIVFNDFQTSYLLGSLALAVILFEGGLKTKAPMVKLAIWPAVALATAGVLISALLIDALAVWLFHLSWAQGLMIGAAVAPTDAAAVGTLLRLGSRKIPGKTFAMLELESGLNDPISVVLMVVAVALLDDPVQISGVHMLLLVVRQMVGGAALGFAGGYALLWLLRRLKADPGIYPVLAFTGALVIFGGAQTFEASGFLAIYIAGYIIGNDPHKNVVSADEFFTAFSWLAQIGLFLLLGLLVTPHQLGAAVKPALVVGFALMFVVRPAAVFACLLPFKVPVREIGFVSWMGLRGAVPIYLTLIPVLSGRPQSHLLFELVFVVVILSLVVQGWTVGPAARLAGFPKS
jgi:cell volume regulation protein A